ncbi:uncharacterized protein LOC120397331 [Mauremys reevesii]|uniref:uncharacterized protein LOC120397331 n=1 Tax=Mauremys reevesii TaxID=260615 RepID=UPI00193FD6CC|nr:uncharacterized protein LOC120397331 [Mauremys reevesii]
MGQQRAIKGFEDWRKMPSCSAQDLGRPPGCHARTLWQSLQTDRLQYILEHSSSRWETSWLIRVCSSVTQARTSASRPEREFTGSTNCCYTRKVVSPEDNQASLERVISSVQNKLTANSSSRGWQACVTKLTFPLKDVITCNNPQAWKQSTRVLLLQLVRSTTKDTYGGHKPEPERNNSCPEDLRLQHAPSLAAAKTLSTCGYQVRRKNMKPPPPPNSTWPSLLFETLLWDVTFRRIHFKG